MRILFSAFLVFGIIWGSGCHERPSNADPDRITVIDGQGRKVSVPREINRIVTNYGIAAHMVCILGEWNKLKGVDSNSKSVRFFNTISPEIARLPTTGSVSAINLEQTLLLKPDLVLISGKNKVMVDQLASYGLTVFGIVAEDLSQITHTVQNLGVALNRQKKASQFIAYYNATLDLVKERLKDLSTDERPIVFLTGPMGVLSTCSRSMYQQGLIDVCGGRNAGGMLSGAGSPHGWVTISAEQVLQWNPDVILVVHYGPAKPEEILTDRRWQKIKAVENRKVSYFPSFLTPWDYPSPQAVLGIRWLAVTLHPEKFRDVDLLKDTDTFYKTFYGKTFSELGGTI